MQHTPLPDMRTVTLRIDAATFGAVLAEAAALGTSVGTVIAMRLRESLHGDHLLLSCGECGAAIPPGATRHPGRDCGDICDACHAARTGPLPVTHGQAPQNATKRTQP